jgi:hypothetical protein
LAQASKRLQDSIGAVGRNELPKALVDISRHAMEDGRFVDAQAACRLFAQVAPVEHAERLAMTSRLATALAPLQVGQYTLVDDPSGVLYFSDWRGGAEPTAQAIEQAIEIWEHQVAPNAPTPESRAAALRTAGLLYRELDRWPDSDRLLRAAAEAGKGTPDSANALWDLALNAEWANRAISAVETLTEFAKVYSGDPRAASAAIKAQSLLKPLSR